MRPARRFVVLAVFAAAVTLATAASASASSSVGAGGGDDLAVSQEAWVIERYDVLIDVRADGSLEIAEQIEVDFREERRGIYREIPVRYDLAYDADLPLPDPELSPSDYVRVHEIESVSVVSPTAPDDVLITQPGSGGGWLTIRIGQEDTWITGRHTYVIRYRVRGALNRFDSHAELYWNAIGTEWDAPIGQATTTIAGPGLRDAICFQGGPGSDRLCDAGDVDASRAAFRSGSLPPGNGVTVVAAFDPAAVDAGDPILQERFSLARRLVGSDAAWPLAVLVAVVAFGGLGALTYRQGRDRETVGDITAAGTVDPSRTRRRGLFAPRTVPVRFRPPEGLRPAQLGLIVDERVDPVDVSATIVDLAVRGHLRIVEEESTKLLFLTSTDHRLERLEPAPDDPLQDYERRLLDALFEDGDVVVLSDLRGSFHDEYRQIVELVYEDGRSRRWFLRSPATTRTRWVVLGVGAIIVSVGISWLLVLFTRVAVAGLPLVLAALGLIVASRWMPHRTAHGSRVLVETLGFREFIVTAETGRMQLAEREDLFLEYLPYAVVFGATDRWAAAFADLGVAAAAGGWYVTSHGHVPSLDGLSRSLSTFSTAAASGLSQAPASSGSSGFSGGGVGGGGGGGGGGSW